MSAPKMKRIYLDYQATTPVDPRVIDAMAPYWAELFGNPHSSDHSFGWEAHEALEASRSQIAQLIGADSEEIIFTSGATESNNLAIIGTAEAMPCHRNKIIISAIEHKCVISSAFSVQRKGFEVIIAPVNSKGLIDLDFLEKTIDSSTALVSIMAVNNEIGTIQPIHQISEICHKRGVIFHCDAAQAISFQQVDVNDSKVDLLSLSSHKIYGPKGIGALYIRNSIETRPLPIIYGGGQEFGMRSGTLPTPLCVGFGRACSLVQSEREAENLKLATLQHKFIDLLKFINTKISINGTLETRHPGNINILFHGIESSLLLNNIQPLIAASAGSACSSGMPETSHVLQAIGLNLQDANSSIRFSFGRFTTEDDIENAIKILYETTTQIKRIL